MSIQRPEYDEHGGRWATCTRCGMMWLEWREPVELLGEWTVAGERDHECPPPLPRKQAEYMVQAAASLDGIVVSQRQRAQIKLGLEQPPT